MANITMGERGKKKGELVIQCQNHCAFISADFWGKKEEKRIPKGIKN
jgi:hypothetical protein